MKMGRHFAFPFFSATLEAKNRLFFSILNQLLQYNLVTYTNRWKKIKMILASNAKHAPAGRKFQRLIFGILLLAAFIVDGITLVAVIAILMVILAIIPWRYSPTYLLHRLHSPAPPKMYEPDSSEAAFACCLGAFFLLVGLVCHYFGMENLAWTLVLIVAVLSLLAGTVGFCLGSFIFLWLKGKFSNGT